MDYPTEKSVHVDSFNAQSRSFDKVRGDASHEVDNVACLDSSIDVLD